MKKFFKTLLDIIDSMSRARAAAELTRQGLYKEAQSLMRKD
jgi:molecular chaperone GrpE (heat shock protein)